MFPQMEGPDTSITATCGWLNLYLSFEATLLFGLRNTLAWFKSSLMSARRVTYYISEPFFGQ